MFYSPAPWSRRTSHWLIITYSLAADNDEEWLIDILISPDMWVNAYFRDLIWIKSSDILRFEKWSRRLAFVLAAHSIKGRCSWAGREKRYLFNEERVTDKYRRCIWQVHSEGDGLLLWIFSSTQLLCFFTHRPFANASIEYLVSVLNMSVLVRGVRTAN